MFKAFWTWNPVSSTSFRPFDEPYMYRNNDWFFDKSVWTRMFSAMSECGFNSMVLANTHPFPFMVDLKDYPQAKVIDDNKLREYQEMYHWIFNEGNRHGIGTYILFFSIYYPDPLLEYLGIEAKDTHTASDYAIEYTNYCVKELLKEYPELAGIIGDASENIQAEKREAFLQGAVIDAVDEVKPDIHLMIRGYWSDPSKMTEELKRRDGRPITWTNKYTYEHIVHTEPDPRFRAWIDNAGAENVVGEFWISNYEPWSCFSFSTLRGILDNLEKFGCPGFSVHALSMYQWPFSPDIIFEYQWERDMPFYKVWGGAKPEDITEPSWVSKYPELLEGFEAASTIMERLALYIAGDRENQWNPMFCRIKDYNRTHPHLLTIEDMLNFDDQPVFKLGKNWWEHVTGQRVVHFAEHLESGTPKGAYGPVEFISELYELSSKGVEASVKALGIAKGDPPLMSAAVDAFCMSMLGAFYAERSLAALAHGRGNNAEALERLKSALGFYSDMVEADSQHRTPTFRVLAGRATVIGDWNDTLNALEAEYQDALAGEFKRGTNTYPLHKVEGGW